LLTFAFRSIRLPGMSDADANAYARTLKMYPLSDAANPKPTRFFDGIAKRNSSLPYYDFRYFQELHEIISIEPVRPRDKMMMGWLASIGIEAGKPFNPTPKARAAMERAVVDAYFYMQDLVEKAQAKNLYWPDRHWSYFFITDANGGFTFDTDNMLETDKRAVIYHPATLFPARLPARPATVYLCGMADSEGRPLAAGKTYRLRVPKDVPVKQFWAVNVYDFATWAFIYNPLDRVGLNSYLKPNMKLNDDGSMDLYIGPKAPKGLESNWIPTQGKRPFPVVRMYGADEAFWDKSFKMPDVELVK
jgi:hypothetical protein